MDRWTDRLSAYLDDEMGREERRALEAHLDVCPDCRKTLDELRDLVGRAHRLTDSAPKADLWPAILERIRHGLDVVPIRVPAGPGRRFALTSGQAAAAAAALLLTGAVAAWFVRDPAAATPAVFETTGVVTPAGRAVPGAAPEEIVRRIAELKATLAAARTRLDPVTVAVIEKNLALVEAAVEEAEAALSRDPANDYLRAHLDRMLRTEIELLRRATTLAET